MIIFPLFYQQIALKHHLPLVHHLQGTSSLSTNEDSTKGMYAVEFCGYFPTDNPKYSIIVSINKTGLPASGELMAGDAFRQFVDKIMEK